MLKWRRQSWGDWDLLEQDSDGHVQGIWGFIRVTNRWTTPMLEAHIYLRGDYSSHHVPDPLWHIPHTKENVKKLKVFMEFHARTQGAK